VKGFGPKSPFFRSARGRTGELTGEAMHRVDAYRMIQRRAAELGMKVKIGCHIFRITKVRAPPNFTIAPEMRSCSTRSSGLRSKPVGSVRLPRYNGRNHNPYEGYNDLAFAAL
jgi:hypothetical protein